MTDKKPFDSKDLDILNLLTIQPDISQAEIAKALGFAVGTVNSRLKKLVSHDFLEAHPGGKRKINHVITNMGRTFCDQMNASQLDKSFSAFRSVRTQMLAALENCRTQKATSLFLSGKGDALEICRLIAVDQGFKSVQAGAGIPVIHIKGLALQVDFPGRTMKNGEQD